MCKGLRDAVSGVQERQHGLHVVAQRELDKVNGTLDNGVLVRRTGLEGVR